MKKQWRWMAFGLAAALSTLPLHAAENTRLAFAELFKIPINRMVREVGRFQAPAMKRVVLSRTLEGVETGLEKVITNPSVSESERKVLNGLRDEFHAYRAELLGTDGFDAVADSDLDAFAAFIQQDRERAGWGTGGIYLSSGVLLVILLLILIL
jgi:hypothetical protein